MLVIIAYELDNDVFYETVKECREMHSEDLVDMVDDVAEEAGFRVYGAWMDYSGRMELQDAVGKVCDKYPVSHNGN